MPQLGYRACNFIFQTIEDILLRFSFPQEHFFPDAASPLVVAMISGFKSPIFFLKKLLL